MESTIYLLNSKVELFYLFGLHVLTSCLLRLLTIEREQTSGSATLEIKLFCYYIMQFHSISRKKIISVLFSFKFSTLIDFSVLESIHGVACDLREKGPTCRDRAAVACAQLTRGPYRGRALFQKRTL